MKRKKKTRKKNGTIRLGNTTNSEGTTNAKIKVSDKGISLAIEIDVPDVLKYCFRAGKVIDFYLDRTGLYIDGELLEKT